MKMYTKKEETTGTTPLPQEVEKMLVNPYQLVFLDEDEVEEQPNDITFIHTMEDYVEDAIVEDVKVIEDDMELINRIVRRYVNYISKKVHISRKDQPKRSEKVKPVTIELRNRFDCLTNEELEQCEEKGEETPIPYKRVCQMKKQRDDEFWFKNAKLYNKVATRTYNQIKKGETTVKVSRPTRYVVGMLGQPVNSTELLRQYAQEIQSAQPFEEFRIRPNMPKTCQPRMIERPEKSIMIFKGQRMAIRKRDTWKKSELLAKELLKANIQQSLAKPSTPMHKQLVDVMTNYFMEKTSLGKQLNSYVMLNLINSILSSVIFMYNIITHKGFFNKMVNSLGFITNVITAIVNVCIMSKLKQVDIAVQENLKDLLTNKLVDYLSHFSIDLINGNEEKIQTLADKLDIKETQTYADFITAETTNISDTFKQTVYTDGLIEFRKVDKFMTIEEIVEGINLHDEMLPITGILVEFMRAEDRFVDTIDIREVETADKNNASFFNSVWGQGKPLFCGRDIRNWVTENVNSEVLTQNEQFMTAVFAQVQAEHDDIQTVAQWVNYIRRGLPLTISDAQMLVQLTGQRMSIVVEEGVYHLKPTMGVVIDNFPLPLARKPILIQYKNNKFTRCEWYARKEVTDLTVLTRKLIDNILFHYSDVDANLANNIVHLLIERHNSFITTEQIMKSAQIQGDKWQDKVSMSVNMGINFIAFCFTAFEVSSDESLKGASTGKKLIHFRNISKATKEMCTENFDMIKEVFAEFFHIHLDGDAARINILEAHYDKLREYNQMGTASYVANPERFYEVRDFYNNVFQNLHTLTLKSKDIKAGYVNIERSVRTELAKLDVTLRNVKELLTTAKSRKETLPIYIFGARGAGKTKFVTDFLLPKLAQKLGISPKTYSLNFGNNKYYPPYYNQKFGVYDEFMMERDQDPLLPDLNRMFSSAGFNMEGADLAFKYQPCMLDAMFLISNQPYVELKQIMTCEAESAVYSRLSRHAIHFVNVKQDKSMRRDDIPRSSFDDEETYELRLLEQDIDSSHNYSMYDGPTEEPIYCGTIPYTVLSVEALVERLAEAIRQAGVKLNEQRSTDLRLDLQAALMEKDNVKDIFTKLKALGYEERNIQDALNTTVHNNADNPRFWSTCKIPKEYFKFEVQGITSMIFGQIEKYNTQNVTITNDSILDHFVVNISGPSGTGKSQLGIKLANAIAKFKKMSAFSFTKCGADELSAVRFPSVILLNDCVTNELDFINFYDKLPKPSIIINTNNLEISKVKVPSRTWLERGLSLAEKTDDAGWFARLTQQTLLLTSFNYTQATRIVNPGVSTMQPGFMRRVGIGGPLYNDVEQKPVVSQRNMTNSLCYKTDSGFRIFEFNIDSAVKEATYAKIMSDILTKYETYVEVYGDVKIESGTNADVDAFVTPNTADVYIKSADLKGLIKLTRSFNTLVAAATGKTFGVGKDIVKISNRVINANYTYQPMDFAIPLDATPEEVTEIALRMYRALISGNTDFSVLVECKDLRVAGHNGLIKYSTQHNRVSYDFEINDDTVLFNAVNIVDDLRNVRTIAQFSKHEIAKQIVFGFDYKLLKERLEPHQIQAFVGNVMFLEQDPAMIQYIERMGIKKQVIDSNLEAKKQFAMYLEKWMQSTLFKIAFAILGLLAISYIFKMLVGLITGLLGMNKIESVKIQVPDMTGEYKDIIVSTEMQKDKDFGYVVNKINCTYDDFVWGDIPYSQFKQQAIEELDRYFERQGLNYQMGDFTELDIQSDISQTKKRSTMSNIKYKQVPTRRIQGAMNTGYANTQKKTISNIKHSRVRPMKVQDSIREVITNKVYKQIFEIKSQTGATLKGIGIKQNYIVCPAHIWHGAADEVFVVKNLTTGSSYTAVPKTAMQSADILLLEVTDRSFPPLANVTKYFIANENKYNVSMVSITTLRPDGHGGLKRVEKVGNSFCAKVNQDISIPGDNFTLNRGVEIFRTSMVEAGIPTIRGDCGLPLMSLSTSNEMLLGMHVAGVGTRIYATMLTQEMLNMLIESAESREIQAFYDCETEDDDKYEDALDFYQTELPYADGTTETVVFEKATMDILEDMYDSPKIYPCLDGFHTKNLGYTAQGARSMRLKSKHVKSIFFDELSRGYIENKVFPALVNPALVKDKSKLMVNGLGEPSILITQVEKFNNRPRCDMPTVISYLQRARDMLMGHYKTVYGYPFKHRLLSECEMINGLVVNPREALFGCLEAINRDGSTGLEIGRKGIHTNGQLLTAAGFTNSYGAPMRKIDTEKPAGKYLVEFIEEQLYYWAKGTRCETLVQDNLKPELLKESKNDIGKTRCFESFGIATTLNCRRLFGTILAAFKKQRAYGFAQVGIDKKNFEQIVNRLKKVSTLGEAGDFENYDKNMQAPTAECATDLMWGIYEAGARRYMNNDVLSLPEIKTAFYTAMKANIKGTNIADGHVYTKNKGNCSGCLLTTVLNCIANDLKRVAVILYLIDEHNKVATKPTYVEELLEEYKKYDTDGYVTKSINSNKHIIRNRITPSWDLISSTTDWINYGDDKVSVIAFEYIWLLNFVSYKRTYMELFGINYDAPSKDGTIEILSDVHSLSFISRTLTNQNGTVCPMLKMSTIDHLFMWTTANTADQLISNLKNAFDELSLWPVNVYEKYCEMIPLINQVLRDTFGAGVSFTPEPWITKRDNFIDSVKFDEVVTSPYDAEPFREGELEREILEAVKAQRIQVQAGFTDNIINDKNCNMDASKIIEISKSIYEKLSEAMEELGNDLTSYPSYSPSERQWIVGINQYPLFLTRKEVQSVVTKAGYTFRRMIDVERVSETTDPSGSDVVSVDKIFVVMISLTSDPKPAVNRFDKKRVSSEVHIEAQNETGATLAASGVEETANVVDNNVTFQLAHGKTPLTASAALEQWSCHDKAFTFQPVSVLTVPVDTTKGSIIKSFQAKDLLTPWMEALMNINDGFVGSFELMMINTVNQGMSGSVMVGMTYSDVTKPTIDMLNNATRKIFDCERKSQITFCLEALTTIGSANVTAIKTGDYSGYYPALHLIAFEDFQSTYDNKTLKLQIHVFARFGRGTRFLNNGPPTGGSTPTPTSSAMNMALLTGGPAKIVLDGRMAHNYTYKAPKRLTITAKGDHVLYQDTRDNVGKNYSLRNISLDTPPVQLYTLDEQLTPVRGETGKLYTRWVNDTHTAKNDEIMYINAAHELASCADELLNDVTFTMSRDKKTPYAEYDDTQVKIHQIVTTTKNVSSESGPMFLDKTDFYDIDEQVVATTYVAVSMNTNYDGQNDVKRFDSDKNNGTLVVDADGNVLHFEISMKDVVFKTKGGIIARALTIPSGDQSVKQGIQLLARVGGSLVLEDFSMPRISNGITFDEDQVTVLPSGSVFVTATRNSEIPSVNDGPALAEAATYFPTVDLASSFENMLNPAKIWQMEVYDTQFSQRVMNLIYHGPKKCCFIRWDSKVRYATLDYSTDKLEIRNITELSPTQTIPTTGYLGVWSSRLMTDADKVMRHSQFVRPNNKVASVRTVQVQGASMALAAGGGLMSGMGQAMQQYQNQMFQMEMFEKNAGLQKELQEIMGKQKYDLMVTQMQAAFENQTKLMEQKYGIDVNLLKEKTQQQLRLRGLNTPAAQREAFIRSLQGEDIFGEHEEGDGDIAQANNPDVRVPDETGNVQSDDLMTHQDVNAKGEPDISNEEFFKGIDNSRVTDEFPERYLDGLENINMNTNMKNTLGDWITKYGIDFVKGGVQVGSGLDKPAPQASSVAPTPPPNDLVLSQTFTPTPAGRKGPTSYLSGVDAAQLQRVADTKSAIHGLEL